MGIPAWTRYHIIRYTGGFVGLEEQAARLGSIVPWDLRGNVILLDDFEYDLANWTTYTSGAGSSVGRVQTIWASKQYSLQLVAGGTNTNYAIADRFFSCVDAVKYSLCFLWYHSSDDDELEVDFAIKSPSPTRVGSILVKQNAGELYVKDAAEVWQLVDDSFPFIPQPGMFFPVRLDLDLATEKYIRLKIAGATYDLSAYGLYPGTTGTKYAGHIRLMAINRGDGGGTEVFDNIVIATNLP